MIRGGFGVEKSKCQEKMGVIDPQRETTRIYAVMGIKLA